MRARRAIGTASPQQIHTRNHLAYSPWCAYSISLRQVKRASPRSVLRRRVGRRDRDLRVALPPPPSRARTQLPDLTPRKPTCGLGTNARGAPHEDLQRALEQLRARREQKERDREGAGGTSGDTSENEDGIQLIPEGEASVCVRVQNWCHRRRVVVARGSEGLGALDEELSDGELELLSQSLLFGLEAVRVSSLHLRVCHRLSYTLLLLVYMVLVEG